jgi:hypothetical protein
MKPEWWGAEVPAERKPVIRNDKLNNNYAPKVQIFPEN